MAKSRKMVSAKGHDRAFRKGSYVKKDNRSISLHRGGYRIV